MGGNYDQKSPLETAADVTGARATEAFELLSNETRLGILLSLWEAYEPFSDDDAVPFSELRERLGRPDSGQFNYHLDKLTGHFIQATPGGYELREAGQKLVRAVIAGTGLEEITLSPTQLDMACHRCGDGRVEISYRDEAVYLTCPECEGFMAAEKFPSGTLARYAFDPAGLAGRDSVEILVGGVITENNQYRMMRAGICPECSGAIDASLHVCENHEPDPREICPNCGTRDSARVRYICTVCKNWIGGPVQIVLMDHPVVIAFYYDHNVDIRRNINEIDHIDEFRRVWELFWEQEHSLVSVDPVRIRVTVPCEGDELQLLLDEELNVIDEGERK